MYKETLTLHVFHVPRMVGDMNGGKKQRTRKSKAWLHRIRVLCVGVCALFALSDAWSTYARFSNTAW